MVKPHHFSMDFPYFEWLFGSGNPPFSTQKLRHLGCPCWHSFNRVSSTAVPIGLHGWMASAGSLDANSYCRKRFRAGKELDNVGYKMPALQSISNISIQHVGYTSVPHIF